MNFFMILKVLKVAFGDLIKIRLINATAVFPPEKAMSNLSP
jgi:hypothetical protein